MITVISLSLSILNKLTPDNFEKLSREVIHHACTNNSKEIKKGAILLVSRCGRGVATSTLFIYYNYNVNNIIILLIIIIILLLYQVSL